VTAVEVMPVATFPGNRGWGYDGVYAYAPHPAYGGPEGLARFVDAAHREGLGVLLDVVYNHIGPGSEAIGAFGPYFTDRYETFWGNALDYSQRGVREWAIQNAEHWTRDYKLDGLRVDAVHAVHDEFDPHVLRELADRVHPGPPPLLFMGEEYDEERPFQFFTDHGDPAVAEATRQGRKEEFASFASFAGDAVPDPQDPASFERSKLAPRPPDPFYRELLAL